MVARREQGAVGNISRGDGGFQRGNVITNSSCAWEIKGGDFKRWKGKLCLGWVATLGEPIGGDKTGWAGQTP